MAVEDALRAVGLRKAFRSPAGRTFEILAGVDLTLVPGEYVAVTGRSGSGKSTLLNLLGCLDCPDAGDLSFGTLSLTGASRRVLPRFRAAHLGFVFQEFHLIASLTAWENVILAARYCRRDPVEAGRTAMALFERLGIAERREAYPPALSGGEQQRVAFCRAVLNDPAVILADEPTGNLDDENATVLLGELRERARSLGTAVLLVTHSRSLAQTADRVCHLADGQLSSVVR